MAHFMDRLTESVRRVGNAVLVGLDPRFALLPDALKKDAAENPELQARACERFCHELIDVVAPLVAAVKPQVAFFEQFGPPGMEALSGVVQFAREKELLVIVDGKRNDIGSTAAAYAQAWLGGAKQNVWSGDALTVSPYLGDDSLLPFVELAGEQEAGVFVLVKTSNPGGAMLQDLVADGRPVYRHVADMVEQYANGSAGQCGYGHVGAVVGATYPEQLAELRQAMPHTWFLVPGFGSQGATAADVSGAFDERGLGAIVNSSRGINYAFSQPQYAEEYGAARWQRASEAAVLDMIEQLRAETPAGQLSPG